MGPLVHVARLRGYSPARTDYRGAAPAGMDVVRAQDRGMCGRADELLLEDAASLGRLLLTNDRDFLSIHAAWRAVNRDHAGIIYWKPGKYSTGEAIRRIIDYASRTAAADAANIVHYL